MILTNKHAPFQAGISILEIIVIVLVLFSLVSIFFIGARAWKSGTDRAGCITQIHDVQLGVRAYAKVNSFSPGTTVNGLQDMILSSGKYVGKYPSCPSRGNYTFGGDMIPAIGTLYMKCDLAVADGHLPADTDDW